MLRRLLITLTASVTLVAGVGVPAASAAPHPAASSAGQAASSQSGSTSKGHDDRDGDYLALGDSVPFGYSPLVTIPSSPKVYVGYPQFAARRLDLRLTNLSCPGQTTGGFLSLTGTDNGCFTFRSVAKLHTSYSGSQLDAAVAFLKTHRHTRLVSLMLGANDLFLCQKGTADGCTNPAEVAATLRTAAANLTTALTAIRAVYRGPLLAVTYYTTDFSDPAGVGVITALNGTLSTVVTSFGGSVADGFAPFRKASAKRAGSACAAHLLIALPTGGCDVHPTRRGARLLASAVVTAAHAAWRHPSSSAAA